MTEEKYLEIKSLKEKMEKVDRDIKTIEYLINSSNLGMEITGTSDCKFKIKRYINFDGDDNIKSILNIEKNNLIYKLSKLKDNFDKL